MAVFGVPHPKWIEAVTAIVVLKAGATATVEQIQTYCRETLTHYKAPKHIAITDQLPKNASGKILKRDLRQQYGDVFAED